ncbi:MAG: hypothetical protein Q7R96_03400 [Nanoarchaeota archaeon]|nr:hypothetical protein [Nanoarchaeota archaeon]
MFLSKKGDAAPHDLLYKIAILLITIFIAIGIYVIFAKTQNSVADASTKENLKALAYAITVLTEQPETIAVIPHPLYLSKDAIFVGFGKEQAYVTDTCGDEEVITKPLDRPECQEACICSYKQTTGWQDFGEDTTLINCLPIPVDSLITFNYARDRNILRSNYRTEKLDYFTPEDQNILTITRNFQGKTFLKQTLPENYANSPYNYQDFVLYGNCEYTGEGDIKTPEGTTLRTLEASPLGTQKLFLEKTITEEKTTILIAYEKTKGYTERLQLLQQQQITEKHQQQEQQFLIDITQELQKAKSDPTLQKETYPSIITDIDNFLKLTWITPETKEQLLAIKKTILPTEQTTTEKTNVPP